MLAAGTTELNFRLNNSKENVRLNDIEIKESVFPEAQKVCQKLMSLTFDLNL